MISRVQYEEYKEKTLSALAKAGIALTAEEKENVEVADFGLNRLEEIGLQVVTYVNTERCCAKELVLTPYQICPEHRHPEINGTKGKEETFRCRQGEVWLYVGGFPDSQEQKEIKGKIPEERNYTEQTEMTYGEQTTYIRELAKRYAQLSDSEENQQKRQRWADHNDLKKRQQPLLWVCPDDDGGWKELVPESGLVCSDPILREIENKLKKYIYQDRYLKDDFVFEKRLYFDYPGRYTGYLYGNTEQKEAWGISIVKPKIGNQAYHLDNFLKTEEDYEKLLNHEVDFLPDEEKKKALKEQIENVLDGILDVEFHLPYSVLVQSHLIEMVHLRGLENLMYDLYDDPDRLKAVFLHMGESKARLLKRLEEQKLLFDNRINIYTGSGSLGYTNDPWKKPEEMVLRDMWGFADAQEFSGVSAEMFEEFAIAHQKIGLNLFGRGCYGCCEPLDHKYEAIYRHISNIRRLSVSPWSDVDEAAEKIGKKAIFSWKPDPAKICQGFNEEEIRPYLKNVADKTKDCFVEIILKDIRTCGNMNRYLIKFINLVREIFE